MADWYCSSAAYATYAAFQTSHTYAVGNIVVPTAPTAKNKWAFRVSSITTGISGGTEPTWPTANNSTVTSGGVTFTNVTGQSTYFWTAAAGDMPTLQGGGSGAARMAAGDRMFVSSDHSETQTASTTYGGNTTSSFSLLQFLSVNRSGSTPPVAADLLAGATCTVSSGLILFEGSAPSYFYGFTFAYTGTGTTAFQFGSTSAAFKNVEFDTCLLYLNTATANVHINWNQPTGLILKNTPLQFGNTAQSFINTNGYAARVTWIATPSAIAGATIPSTLITLGSVVLGFFELVARGVDLSAITGTLIANSTTSSGNQGNKYLFDSCKIASGVTRYNSATGTNPADRVDLVNCFDGTNTLNESYQPAGTLTTERSITLTGGAQDNNGNFSFKMVSSSSLDKYVEPMDCFWIDCNFASPLGSSLTATVEIISSASLNNDEIWLLLEYCGTASSPVASFASSLPANVLSTPSAVTSSTATWNATPATPVKQKLQVTFTPQTAGRLRGLVRLGKASTTVYVNPEITVT